MKVLELVLKPKNSENLTNNKQLVQALFSYVCQTLEVESISIAIAGNALTLWLKLPENKDEKLIVRSVYEISNKVITEGLNLVEDFWEEKYVLHSYGHTGEMPESKKIKCLVTGGAGFIGSNLVDGLLAQGNEVVVVDNLYSGKREYLNPAAKFYEADVVDQRKMQEIFAAEQFDYVFHLAAQISVSDSTKDPIFDMNVNARGSFNIFEAAKGNGVRKVIFTSTGGALYGDVTEPAHEEMLVAPVSPYAIHKFTAERYLELFRTEYNLDYIILRLANVYGPRQYKGGEGAVVATFTHNIVNDLPSTVFGDGSKTRDYAFVGDVVSACLAAMKSDFIGTINIGTGDRVSVLDLLRIVEKAGSKKFIYSHGADRAGEVQDSVLAIDRAKQVLGWQPATTLEEGIRKTLEWVRGNS